MRDSLRLGRVAGFPVAVNWSVLVVVLLLAWSLADGVLPASVKHQSTAAYWIAGVVGALLLLCSLLAHELAHAVVAQRAGVEVEGLTLWMFGGIATLRGEPATARDDFRIAAVGPATSLALGVLFGGVWWVLDVAGSGHIVAAVAGWLASINVLLGIFNLIPGAPLDGGRVLRAALWRRSGDRYQAALSATNAGQVVAYCLIGLGLLNFVSGNPVGGLWMMLIGWFVLSAAKAEYTATVMEHSLHDVRVGDIMSTHVEAGDAELSVQEFVDRCVLGGHHSAYPLLGTDGRVAGLVTLEQLRRVPPADRVRTPVRDVAVPVEHVATCAPSEPVPRLLTRVTRETGNRALVLEDHRLVGIVTPTDITRALDQRTLSRSGV